MGVEVTFSASHTFPSRQGQGACAALSSPTLARTDRRCWFYLRAMQRRSTHTQAIHDFRNNAIKSFEFGGCAVSLERRRAFFKSGMRGPRTRATKGRCDVPAFFSWVNVGTRQPFKITKRVHTVAAASTQIIAQIYDVRLHDHQRNHGAFSAWVKILDKKGRRK